ncbi:MAG: helix-turn-helix domain-containing protein [Acidimicrobiales bacterium]
MSTRPLLRPEEVAEALAVSKVTVYRLARSGELASVRVRGQFRFRPEALDDYLVRCEVPAVAAAPRASAPAAPTSRRGRPRKQWGPPDAA